MRIIQSSERIPCAQVRRVAVNMLWTGCVIFALSLLSAPADAQDCYCWSAVWVDPASGFYNATSHTEFEPGLCEECFFESAYVEASLYENGYNLWSDFAQDNLGIGTAEVDAYGTVDLNSDYVINGQNEITGDWFFNEYTLGEYDVPAPPTIQAQSVDAQTPDESYIYYTVTPAVLYSSTVEVGGQNSVSGSSGSADFYFNEGALPDGTSDFTFYGLMYGYYVTTTQASVARTEVTRSNSEAFSVPVGDNPPEYQQFEFDAYEFASNFSYSVSASGMLTLINGGNLNVSTSQADGPATISQLIGTNTVSDSYGDYDSAFMSPPQGPTEPPQGPYFMSLDNSWSGAWFFSGGTGAVAVEVWTDQPNGSYVADPPTLIVALP